MHKSILVLLILLSTLVSGCAKQGPAEAPGMQTVAGEEGLTPRNQDLRSFYVHADLLRDETGLRKGATLWLLPEDMEGDTVPISGSIDLTLYNTKEFRTLHPGVKEYVKGGAVYQKRILVFPTYAEMVVEVPWEEVAEYPFSRPNFGVLRIEFKGDDGTELRQDYWDAYGVTSDTIWLRDPSYSESTELGRLELLKRYYDLIIYQFTKLFYEEQYLGESKNVTSVEPLSAEVEARLNNLLATLKEAQAQAESGELDDAISIYSGTEAELGEMLKETGLSGATLSNLEHLSSYVGHKRAAYGKEVEAEGMISQINASRKRCSEEMECEEYRELMTSYNSLKKESSEEQTLARVELESIVGWDHLELPER